MKKFNLTLIFIITYKLIFSQSIDVDWVKNFDGVSFGGNYGVSSIIDNENNIYSIGEFSRTIDLNPGTGVHLLNCINTSVIDIYISKLDSFGNFKWGKSLKGNYLSTAKKIILDKNNNIYVVGEFDGTVDFNPDTTAVFNLTSVSSKDVFILKLNNNGEFIWVKRFDGTRNVNVNDIVIDKFENVLTVGSYYGTCDFDPGLSIFNLTSPSTTDDYAFISKIDSNGNFVWAKSFITPTGGKSEARSTVIDSSNNIYIAGLFLGNIDFDPDSLTYVINKSTNTLFLSKLDVSGNFIWVKTTNAPPGSGSVKCYSLKNYNNKNIIISGGFFSSIDFNPDTTVSNVFTSNGNEDIFLLNLTIDGEYKWFKHVGGLSDDRCNSSCIDASGNIYVTGFFRDSADFDPSVNIKKLYSQGSNPDIFIAKYDTSGNLIFAKSNRGITYEDVTS